MPPSRIDVLYVEDSTGDVLLTKQILSEFLQPVKLFVARDGLQALMMLADEHFQPAMIILDLSLPVLSGYEVLKRNPRKDIPVVIFSALQNPADVAQTLSLGAKEYVHKPIDRVTGTRCSGWFPTARCLSRMQTARSPSDTTIGPPTLPSCIIPTQPRNFRADQAK
jgi:CheY-like chemotaxis protein